jgi:hypothetical protein
MRKLWWSIPLILLGITICLFIWDLRVIIPEGLFVFWENVKILSSALSIVFPLIIGILMVYLLTISKWRIQFKELSIGGLHIFFSRPEQLFIRKISNYLSTKRTIFIIDIEKDNFKETLDSFHEIYKFLRKEIEQLEDFSNVKRNVEISKLHNLTIDAVKTINIFLTNHQSDFRRWYSYYEKTQLQEGVKASFYLNPIGKFQVDYYNYNKLCADFEEVNKFFCGDFAKVFNINCSKWTSKD